MADVGVAVDVAHLYATYRLPLVRLAVLLVDDQASAEDAVQEAFVGLHRNRDKIKDLAAVPGYLRISVVNHARTALRQRQSARRFNRYAELETGPGADATALLNDEHREVYRAIQQLPERMREVIVLRFYANLSEAEIAEALGITRGAVKSQASRAMDKLEAILGGSR